MSVIAVYVVTYRKPVELAANLRSLHAGLSGRHDVRVTVLSNSPEVSLPADLPVQPRLVLNGTRSAHAWGYLARDWNWALLDAFGTWRGSDVDWAVLSQDDVTWLEGWDDRLAGVTEVDFLSQPRGDQVLALRLPALLATGFFDERFCTLHFHEQDYFCRAILALDDRASITDDHEGFGESGSWNPLGALLIPPSHSGFNDDDERFHTRKSHAELANLLLHKWGAARVEQFFDRYAFRAGVGAGLITPPRELEFYPFFWDGYPVERQLATDYDPPRTTVAASVLVVGGPGGRALHDALMRLATDLAGTNHQVLVTCEDNPGNWALRAALTGRPFHFFVGTYDPAGARAILERSAASENVRVVDLIGP